MSAISKNAVIYPNVEFGQDCVVEDFAVIGAPPRGCEGGELKTVIGSNAVIRSHTVIYAGNRIGDSFQTGNKANIRELNEIGDNVTVGTGSVVEHHVRIGNDVRLHSGVFVPEYCVLEDDCWLGPNVTLTNARYPRSKNVKNELKGVVVRKGAKLGANVTVLSGVIIGENSLIGAGSVVVGKVTAGKVFAGNPAREINDITNLPY